MEDHSRTIIHIDIDCFYAQVEMLKDPNLRNKPLGIKQKNIVVTSNYIAREYGIKKCMLITEAKKLCPNLVLVNGEDLYDYRQISFKVTSLLQAYSEMVERLGLDENFIDVTELVNERLKTSSNTKLVGYTFGEQDILCDCGCTERISVGAQIAQEIRNQIFKELSLTVCAGIAHNKLLAKIVGSKNKPNKQTIVLPNNATELILSLEIVKNIPGIGNACAEQLSKIGITKVMNLQTCNIEKLKTHFGLEKAKTLWNLSLGVDSTPVKKTGKPQSIGLEESCAPITDEKGIEDKLRCLLRRLMILVNEDKRIPKTVKLTVRKFDSEHPPGGIRETRQCNISTSLNNEEIIISIVMSLFRKAVDTKKKFQVTLLGLSFTKFAEKTNKKNTLTNFFSGDIKVQSYKHLNDSKVLVPIAEPSTSLFNDEQAKSLIHIPKDGKVLTINKPLEYSKLPLKLDTPKLLNSAKSEQEIQKKITCPPNVNEDVFRELPKDVQEEVWNDYKRKMIVDDTQRPSKKLKTGSILNYIIRQKNSD